MFEWFINNEDLVKIILVILTIFLPIIIAFFAGRFNVSQRLEKLVLSGYAVGYIFNALIIILCLFIYYFYYSEQGLEIWALFSVFWLYVFLLVLNSLMALKFFINVSKIK